MMPAVSALPPNVSLLVAALDLKLVQLLRNAIATADLSQGTLGRASALGPAPTPDTPHVHPEPVFEPRPHYHLAPRFEPRPLLYAPAGAGRERCRPLCWAGGDDAAAPGLPAARPECESPMQPPWKVLPWQNPPAVPPAQKIKVRVYRPDIAGKGSTIDLFV